MAQERFMRLSGLRKGDVVRSPLLVEPTPGFWTATPGTRKRMSKRGALFAVVVIERRSYRPLILFKRIFHVVELRELKNDGSYDYDGESLVLHPGLDRNNIDFFVEVMGQMNFRWDGIEHAEAER